MGCGSRCGCAPCGGMAGAFGYAGMGSLFNECDAPRVVLDAGAVDALRSRIFAKFEETAKVVRACAGLSPADRGAWESFFLAFRDHIANDESSWWSAARQWDQACAYGRELEAWQAKLRASSCDVPMVVPPDAPVGAASLASVAKLAAVAVIAVAVVVGARTVLR